MINLAKLTPGPCRVEIIDDVCGSEYAKLARADGSFFGSFWLPDDAEFYVLARNAFDVMMRRGWFVVPNYCNRPGTFWRVKTGLAGDLEIEWREWPDPFTALVEADAWYKANVEKA